MALAVVGGGRRSGKSRYALALASAHGPRLGLIATLQPADEESRRRVDAARDERGARFVTVEAPLDLTAAHLTQTPHCDAVVIDELTVWVSNQVMAGHGDAEIERQAAELTAQALRSPAETIIVTSEIDAGFPMDAEPSRRFRRLAGLINQSVVESSSRLYWMVFGVPKRIR